MAFCTLNFFPYEVNRHGIPKSGNIPLPFIASCTNFDTRVLYSQKMALGGLCEVLRVSWITSLSMTRRNKHPQQDVQDCLGLVQLLTTLIAPSTFSELLSTVHCDLDISVFAYMTECTRNYLSVIIKLGMILSVVLGRTEGYTWTMMFCVRPSQ